MMIESMKSKMISLQNSLDDRNIVYDQEILNSKQKLQAAEQYNTNLMIEKEMVRDANDRLEKENRKLHEKIAYLQEKIENKNKFINDLKSTFNKK